MHEPHSLGHVDGYQSPSEYGPTKLLKLLVPNRKGLAGDLTRTAEPDFAFRRIVAKESKMPYGAVALRELPINPDRINHDCSRASIFTKRKQTRKKRIQRSLAADMKRVAR